MRGISKDWRIGHPALIWKFELFPPPRSPRGSFYSSGRCASDSNISGLKVRMLLNLIKDSNEGWAREEFADDSVWEGGDSLRGRRRRQIGSRNEIFVAKINLFGFVLFFFLSESVFWELSFDLVYHILELNMMSFVESNVQIMSFYGVFVLISGSFMNIFFQSVFITGDIFLNYQKIESLEFLLFKNIFNYVLSNQIRKIFMFRKIEY